MAAFVILAILTALGSLRPARASPIYTTSIPTERFTDSVAQCIDYVVPVTITSQNTVFNIPKFEDDFDAIDLITDIGHKDINSSAPSPFGGTENVTATYRISGTFCTPKSPSGREKTVLLATHGLGYDRRYWDSAYKPEEYSFVEAAVQQGYSVFYYDRLGTGKSQKISGFVNQLSIQTEIITILATFLRNGNYTGDIGKAKSIVLVGHSFGSLSSNSLLAKYPALADAAVLTGLAYETSVPWGTKVVLEAFAPRIASQLNPSCFHDLDTGYLTFADISAHINGFFKAPAYELKAAKYAHTIAQPFAISEFLSLTSSLSNPRAPEFNGSVLLAAGQYDFIVCFGDCVSTYATQPLKTLFPSTKLLESYVHPGAGHGVNFGKNATGFYTKILRFLDRAGF